MQPVPREEILDAATYGARRDEALVQLREGEARLRLPLGPHLDLQLLDRDLRLARLQEAWYTRALADEAALARELDRLADTGGLEAELRVMGDPGWRRSLWADLPRHLTAVMPDGTEVPALAEAPPDRGLPDRLGLTFPVGAEAPVAFRVAHPDLALEVDLPPGIREALARDLA